MKRHLAIGLICGASALPAHAQLGPELYSVTHFFGSASALSVRGYGMGGASATTADQLSTNPAQAADVGDYQVSFSHGSTRFAGGTRFESEFAVVAVPLGKNDGMRFIYGNTRSPQQSSFASAAFPGSMQRFREQNLGIFYGRRLSKSLAIGGGISPLLATHHTLKNIGAPGLDLDFRGKTIINHLNHVGGRVGLNYRFASWGRTSFYYDNFWEHAKVTAPLALAGAGLVTRSDDFHETAFVGGVELQPTQRLSLVVERGRGGISGQTFESPTVHNTFLGAEWKPKPWLALRTGSNDGSATYGFGIERGQFTLQAASVNGYSADELKPLFGAGNRARFLELGYTF